MIITHSSHLSVQTCWKVCIQSRSETGWSQSVNCSIMHSCLKTLKEVTKLSQSTAKSQYWNVSTRPSVSTQYVNTLSWATSARADHNKCLLNDGLKLTSQGEEAKHWWINKLSSSSSNQGQQHAWITASAALSQPRQLIFEDSLFQPEHTVDESSVSALHTDKQVVH